MPEITSDGDPFQMPLAAANETYSRRTNPGIGSFISATIGDGPAAFLTRGAERGSVEGSSFFDRFLANVTDPEMAAATGVIPPGLDSNGPLRSPQMAPEQYNEQYAPRDADGKVVPIGDKPMPEALAQIIGKQKTEALEREGVLSRFSETHSGVTTFLAGSAASMLDPLNAGSLFIPGVGEGALAARLGGGLVARTGARLLAGGATGALMQAPISGIKMAMSPEEASDYGISDAMRDMLYGAAGVAAFHTGIGTLGEVLGRARRPGDAAIPKAGMIAPDASTTNAAMRSAVGEIAEGRPVDVAPVMDAAGAAPRAEIPPSDNAIQGPATQDRAMTPQLPELPPGLIGEPIAGIPRHIVATSDGQSVDVAPVVVEARDLRTSADESYDLALQPRDRNRAAAEQQVREMASRLEPERLGFSAEADRGAPIVGADGMVESGNGRVMAIREAYGSGNDAATRYRAWLKTQGVDVDRYQQPVLVRQRLTQMTPEQRQGFAVAANRSTTLALSAPERALADARSITSDMLGLIRNPDDLAAIANRDFVRAFVQRLPQTEHGIFANAEGGLSAEGLGRLRNAILARAYGATPEGTAILSRISESIHDDIKSVSNALTAAAPDWAGLRADIEAGRVRPDVDLTPQLIEAVRRTADLRAKGTKLADALAQQDAFDRIEKPVEDWMRMFYDPAGRRAAGAARIAEGLKVYAAEARKISAERGLDLGLPDVAATDIQRIATDRANSGGRAGEAGLFVSGGLGDGAHAATNRGSVQRPEPGGNRASAGGTRIGGVESGQGEPRPAELTLRDIAQRQRDGWAPGLSRDELAAANEAVYGAREAEPQAAPAPAKPAGSASGPAPSPELAAAEEQLARVSPDKLLPEDRAELDRTAAAVTDAPTLGEAMKTAASCLMGLL